MERKKIKLNDDFDENTFSDKFLREARTTREQQLRLKYIDSKLEMLQTSRTESADDSTRVKSFFCKYLIILPIKNRFINRNPCLVFHLSMIQHCKVYSTNAHFQAVMWSP